MAAALAERDEAVADERWNQAVDADARFHQEVVRAGGNALLTELYQGLTEVIRASLAATAGHEDSAWRTGHGELLEAIKARSPATAAHEAGKFLVAHLEGEED
jgi:DNA-binding GntR family transcriptional regulator